MVEAGTKIETDVRGMPIPLPPKENNKDLEKRLIARLDAINKVGEQELREIKTLFEIHRKYKLFQERVIKTPKQPLVFLLRDWHEVEIFEGVRGNTFKVPMPPEHRGSVKVGEELTKKPYKRTVHLSPSDLYNVKWGDGNVKAYFVLENDAVPIGADAKVWSERLEYTLDAILINFEKFKAGIKDTTNQWIVEIIKYGAIAFIGYMVLKWLFFNEAPSGTDVQTATDSVLGALPAGATVVG